MPEKFYGLSRDEVAERMQAGQDNRPPKGPSKSVARVIFDHTFTYFNGVFAVIAVILILVKSYRDLTFLGVILANTLIGIIQELRTKKVLDNLKMLNAAKATVVRDGKMQTIVTDELVLDDVVMFKAGEQIPADAEVLDGTVSVNEALLTGEADEIQKEAGAELLSGSFVVSGECYAKLTRVGEDSYISKLTLQAKAIKTGEQSEIVRSLNRIVRLAGIAIIPVGILLYAHQLLVNHAPISVSVQGAASAVLGMIPEGLFLLASVSLAIGAVKLARQKVLVREMKCIETLARVDVLCVDKTGTITSPEMKVREVINIKDSEKNKEILSQFCSALRPDNETMKALKKYFHSPDTKTEALQVFGFSSKYKYSAAEFKSGRYVLGAPEFVLKDDFEKYKDQVSEYSRKGYRVLMFGEYAPQLTGEELTKSIEPLAMIVLENPVRKTAPETFKYFREQGVAIKVISGDSPLTVSEVARQAEIEGAEKYIDASELKTDADIAEAMKKYVVFGRVTPEQKRKFVKALKKQGHYVAMTGDGVNDVLALKDADCSIAMASGSDAAVQTAQLVLMESDFAKMPQVVREGRRVVNNLERSGSLFIVKNVFSLLAALLTLILGVRYPLLPAQVSMLSVWTIGLPSFFLAQLPNEDLIKGRFMTNILEKAVPGGVASLIAVFAMVGLGKLLGVPEAEMSTACTLAFAIVGVLYLYRICRPINLYRGVVFMGCMLGLTACFVFFRGIFSLAEEISIQTLMICAGLALLTWPMLEFLPKLLEPKLEKLAGKFEKQK
ncbi:MAG: cation-translocating P-type ATPase [Bacteroidales bacterium]|nr:cation-translocating P-type ATPase [Bacteroidales bacterium]